MEKAQTLGRVAPGLKILSRRRHDLPRCRLFIFGFPNSVNAIARRSQPEFHNNAQENSKHRVSAEGKTLCVDPVHRKQQLQDSNKIYLRYCLLISLRDSDSNLRFFRI